MAEEGTAACSSLEPLSLQAVMLAAAAVSDQPEGESWVGSSEERVWEGR